MRFSSTFLAPDAPTLTSCRGRFAAAACLGLLLCSLSACAPTQPPPAAATTPPPPSPTATLPCEQELIPPQIMEIQPAEPGAGSEVKVIGTGGYVRDSCGGYIEGAREFQLYLDHELIGDLSCYVNRCEGNFMLPGTFVVGQHCLSVEAEKCEFEFQVTN